MFIFSIRAVALAVAVSALSLSSAAPLSAQSELLCSPEGLMHLIPQFNVNGQFTIPGPSTDLQTFLSAQQGLSNAIDMILAQENSAMPRTGAKCQERHQRGTAMSLAIALIISMN